MIVKSLGKIFDPKTHFIRDGNIGFAQSPQVLELEDRVRVYFCTRTAEPDGMFCSHVAYADMTKDFSGVLSVSNHDVVPPADLGTFDEHGIFPINVLRVNDQVWGYTCGWSRRKSVAVETGIGLVVSEDEGQTFRRLGSGPIVGASLKEPFLVGDAFVLEVDGSFHMWYMFGQRWVRESDASAPDRVYKIGYASSADGLDWTKKEGVQILPDVLDENECQALPSVIRYRGAYHMVFCYREAFGFRTDRSKGYRIGYARSEDLVTWERESTPLLSPSDPNGWDAEMQCYPHLCIVDDQVYMLYNGNEFGRHGFGAMRLDLKI